MRINSTVLRLNKQFAAVSLLCICAFQPHSLAASADRISPPPSSPSDVVFLLGGIPISFERGETIRITVFNPGQPQAQSPDGRKFKMLVSPLILDAQGVAIAQGEELEIREEQFLSFDFNRDELELAGEAGTGRLQVRSQVRYRFISLVDRTQIRQDDFQITLEVIDNSTGKTGYHQPRAFQIISAGANE
jgi:hypothetical protein